MLVLLKIPLVYLCMVVWWAIRAEPREEQPVVAVPRPRHAGPADALVATAAARGTSPGGRRGPHPRRRPSSRLGAREARL